MKQSNYTSMPRTHLSEIGQVLVQKDNSCVLESQYTGSYRRISLAYKV